MSNLGAALQDKKIKELEKELESYKGANATQGRLDNLFNGESKFSISGSGNETRGRIEGLERAKILTGKNPYQIGEDYQQAYGNIKKRTELADTGSELLRANKAGAVADARNQMQQQGVKGGAALGAVSSVERAKSYDVNNQLAENQRKAEMDYLNATKANANFTQASEMNYGAMAAGRDVKAPDSNSSGFGTVICTEMYEQGLYSKEIYELDRIYGRNLLATKPHVYWGYRVWADYVVKGMRKSKRFTRLVAFFALPWALHMSGEKNLFGKSISIGGEFVCGIIGKIIHLGGFDVYNKKTI